MSKKKLFISCPMNGRKSEDIIETRTKLYQIAKALTGEELEVINSYNPDAEYSDRPIEMLGECVKLMQDADYFIQPFGTSASRGCITEWQVAYEYRIPILSLSRKWLCPDVKHEEETNEED